jgi:DNA gyrase subunit A
MLITTGGVLIRTRVAEIREMGRATQGVTLIAVEDGTKLSGLQRVVETDIDEVELEPGPGTGPVTVVSPDATSDDAADDAPAE